MRILGFIGTSIIGCMAIIAWIPIAIETKIVWLTYLAIPLILLIGSTGIAIFRNLVMGIVIGVVTVALISWFITNAGEILAPLLR